MTAQDARGRMTLPRRSATDRKFGGVAGGIGRALRVDPLLIRVAFVVLTVAGGSGVLLYCLGYLLMPGDDDEVSAIEALAGKGRSSVSPALTIALIIVGLAGAGSVFSWGVPFWPVVIAAVIVFALLAHRKADTEQRGRWARQADDLADRIGDWGARAGDWGAKFGEQVTRWAGGGASSTADPAATQDDTTTSATPSDVTADAAGVADSIGSASSSADDPADMPAETAASTPATATTSAEPPSPEDLLRQGATPPSWDPLGAAPFAWDLPEPGTGSAVINPLPDTPATPRRGGAGGRLVLGLALITGAVTAIGIAGGLRWSVVSGAALGVLGLGMAILALCGARNRMLIGPGIILSLLTAVLALTGISGTGGFGSQYWHPSSASELGGIYQWNAGHAILDLSDVAVPRGTEVHAAVLLNTGSAEVIVPAGVTVDATCEARIGQVDCLGDRRSGTAVHHSESSTGGTMTIYVHNNAGYATVRTAGDRATGSGNG